MMSETSKPNTLFFRGHMHSAAALARIVNDIELCGQVAEALRGGALSAEFVQQQLKELCVDRRLAMNERCRDSDRELILQEARDRWGVERGAVDDA